MRTSPVPLPAAQTRGTRDDVFGYLDCFSGVSGDKFLGALVDAGLSLDRLRERLAGLAMGEWSLAAEDVTRGGLRATRISVNVAGQQPPRSWPEIEALVNGSAISQPALDGALRAFRLLAEAEAKVHGVPLEVVHFHEVGAVDSIVDVVGVAVGLEELGITDLWASPVCTGFGTVPTEHGVLPVPAPATAELLLGVPTYGGCAEGEMTTPTGAALVRAFVSRFGPSPAGAGTAIGYGAGSRDPAVPNVLRLTVYPPDAAREDLEQVTVLESVIDHISPEQLASALELVLEAGALDVWQSPVVMKKGRLGSAVTIISTPDDASRLSDELMRQTGTLGVRRTPTWRSVAPRHEEVVDTTLGEVRVKVGGTPEAERARPESDEVARIARETGAAVRRVAERLARETSVAGAHARPEAADESSAEAAAGTDEESSAESASEGAGEPTPEADSEAVEATEPASDDAEAGSGPADLGVTPG